ncbi:MAG: hypothetical protein J0M36_03315 [Caulobacterales bacterium]|nr:hypothetical protein [Caulobacterales bacterium]
MIRMTLIAAITLGTGACAFQPYEAMPTTPTQWQRRQDEIVRRDEERARLCQMMNKDTDRYRRDCRRPGDPR